MGNQTNKSATDDLVEALNSIIKNGDLKKMDWAEMPNPVQEVCREGTGDPEALTGIPEVELNGKPKKMAKFVVSNDTRDIETAYIRADFNGYNPPPRYSAKPSALKRKSSRSVVKEIAQDAEPEHYPDEEEYALLELREPETGKVIFALTSKCNVKLSNGGEKNEVLAEIADGLTQFMTGQDVDRIKYKAALIHCLAAMKSAEAQGKADYQPPEDGEDNTARWNKAIKMAEACF